jgi:hypothetical protein
MATPSALRNALRSPPSAATINDSSPWWSLNSSPRLVAILVAILVAFEAFRSAVVLNTISSVFDHDRDATFEIPTVWSKSPVLCDSHKSPQELSSVLPSKKITIAYATSITAYDPKQTSTQLIDRAAVLHQSIRLAAQKSPKYDYHMYAFVHPDASGCVLSNSDS